MGNKMKEIQRYDHDAGSDCTGMFMYDKGSFVYYDDIEPIIEENKRMREMLKKFNIQLITYGVYCPSCGNNTVHKPDCELAKLIEE